jgi:hypothetical protein
MNRTLMLAVSCALITGLTPIAAQTRAAVKKPAVQRTADGHPDLQGIWGYATITPLERPAELAGKAVLSDQEAAALERQNAELQNRDRRDHANTTDRGSDGRSDVDRAYNQFWWDFGTTTAGKQTSLVVDPPDGRIPPLVASAQTRAQPNAGFAARTTSVENPEQRNLWERCITRTLPALPGPYNNNIQIVQTKDYVVILNEMIHEARIVPLDNRPLTPLRLWHGQSRGRWEGDTLVVETTNFTDKTRFRGSGENLKVTERFTRVSPDALLYRFTIEDPSTWTKPWTGEYTWPLTKERIYEYACHESNYALENILRGARRREADEAAQKKN